MPPVGAPTKSFSAPRVSAMISSTDCPRSNASSSAVATEHTTAADEDNPAPTGTSLSMATDTPVLSAPRARNGHTTPAIYAAQPLTPPGFTSSRAIVSESCSCADSTCSTSSPSGPTRAVQPCAMASGNANPSL